LARSTHDPRYRRVIDALADARRSAGITQAELASRLGKRQQFISKYESGERRLDVVEFVDISRALELDVQQMLRDLPLG